MSSTEPREESSLPPPDAADRRAPLVGRSRGFWRLTSAADYDRYGHDLLPAWAQVLLGLAGIALAGAFVWRASGPADTEGLWRVLAFLLPVILIIIVLLVRASGPDDDE
ncbi:MAG TPA: hypothetical protein VF137_09540 [Candidatus Dormibacteraeota bacterium]